MPRKLIRRWLPTPPKVAGNGTRRWLGPLLDDPNLLHLNRHSVSGAMFVGLFCAFLPVPGQTIIVSLLALWFHCNLPISVLLIWVSNPLTMAPLTILLYQLGQWILGNEAVATNFEFTWVWFVEHTSSVYLPILIGGLVSGLFFGLAGYISMRILWRWQVVRSWEARKESRRIPR